MIEVSKKRDNYLDLFKQVHGQNSAKKEDLLPLHPLRYKKKLPMLRLKKSHHPLILADPVDDADTVEDDQDAELTSPFGARLGRSKKIWLNDIYTKYILPIPPREQSSTSLRADLYIKKIDLLPLGSALLQHFLEGSLPLRQWYVNSKSSLLS